MKNKTPLHNIITGTLIAMLFVSPSLWGAPETIDDKPEKTTLAGTEYLLISDGGVYKKVSVSNDWKNATITAGTFTGSTYEGLTITTTTGTLTIPTGVTITAPATSGLTMATVTGTETLTNKTLTSPTINNGVFTNPNLQVATVTTVNGLTITPISGGTLSIANSSTFATSGANSLTLTSTGSTNVTLPTTGTLATRAGTESLSNKTLVSPVISTGLTASGSAANTFAASTGTFITSTGANTLSGAVTVADATTPSITLASGKTNTGFFLASGKTSGGIKIIAADTSGFNVVITNATQTTGQAVLTIPDFGNSSDTFAFTTLAQSLSNKTLVTPVISTGLSASGSAANTFVGSTGTFITSTGANTLSGAVTVNAATTPSITLASGKTNTGFVLINGKTSGGLKLIAADSAAQTVTVSLAAQTSGAATISIPDVAGVSDTFALVTKAQSLASKTLVSPVISTGLTASGSANNDFSSSTGGFLTSTGTNTIGGNMVTSGTIVQTSASSAAFASGRQGNTDPVLRLVNNITTQATGISITGRAAAAGVDITTISSGTNENMVINAKGSGTISLNPTATGNVIIGKGVVTPAVVVHSTDGAITIASGIKFLTKAGVAAMTVAAPSSQDGTRMTIISDSDNAHVVTFTGGTLLDGTTGANTTATFAAFKGASITVVARGTTWYVESLNAVTCAP